MVVQLFWFIIYSNLFIDCQTKAIIRPSSLQLNDPFINVPCNFENGLCPGYEIDKSANFEWMLMSGPTNSILTGPDGDNTLNGKGYYVYVESSYRLNGEEARLITKRLNHNKTKGQKLCLEFFYHMKGHTMGEFSVGILTVNDNIEKIQFLVTGNQQHMKWQKGRFSFDTPNQPYKIVFRGKTSFGIYGDIGLDDINVKLAKNGLCDFWPTNATSGSAKSTTSATLQPPVNSPKHPENPKTCGRSKIKLGRIVLGTPVTPVGKWPWMAMLQRLDSENKFDHICGGTLLSNKWIVTAAHCVVNLPATSHIRVRLGTHERNAKEPNTQDIGVKNIYVHPEYNTNTSFNKDIALLELNRPAIINNYVESICLMKNEQQERSTNCIVTGWGRLWGPNTGMDLEYASKLNQASVGIKEQKDCRRNFGVGQVTEYMMCAKGVNGISDTCKGDSGGPLMCQSNDGSWSLVGISSWGHTDGCGMADRYGIYTRMSKLTDWVVATTSNSHLAKPLH